MCSQHITIRMCLAIIGLLLLSNPAASEEAVTPSDPTVYCARMWPEDFVMQKHCIGKQREAARKMAENFHRLVTQEKRLDAPLYHRIVERCAQQHGKDDVAMIEYCTRKQIDAYLSLRQEHP